MLSSGKRKKLSRLLQKYEAGTATMEEVAFIENYYRLFDADPSIIDTLSEEDKKDTHVRLLAKIDGRINTLKQNTPVVPIHRRWYVRASAAAVLLLACLSTWLLVLRPSQKTGIQAGVQVKDVAPGHNGAVLTLSSGQQIVLDSAGNGIVSNEGKVAVIKKDGQISYHGTTAEIVYNTISTAKGRLWQLVLPDGSRVWLNAASSIRYPITFAGSDREVEITGEAYFEVKHNARQPFRVKVGSQEIEDIGTAFNVNAYTDEPVIKTTLLEGSVKISSANNSSPITHNSSLITHNSICQLSIAGQQADLRPDGQLQVVKESDAAQAIAWKNGLFSFTDADLQTVMRQLARWYNVEVKYEGEIPRRDFNGEIGKSLTLDQVLRVLTKTRVHYRIEEGNRLIILP
jgi:ferric-dicitrate binding protein FerR (iron transport regulator)